MLFGSKVIPFEIFDIHESLQIPSEEGNCGLLGVQDLKSIVEFGQCMSLVDLGLGFEY